MPTNTHVSDLKINKLTQSQFNTAVAQGTIDSTQLSIITDATLTVSDISDISSYYLPLTGGTLSGDTTISFNSSYSYGLLFNTESGYQVKMSTLRDSLFCLGNTHNSIGYNFGIANQTFSPNWSGGTSSLGTSTSKWTTLYSTKLNNGSDISIPTFGGTLALQVSTMPTADSTNLDKIVQYVGTTDSNYTNGYFYKCILTGGTYLWERTSVQPTGLTNSLESYTNSIGIGSSSSGGNAAVAIGVSSITTQGSVVIGNNASSTYQYGIAIGSSSQTNNQYGIAIGRMANASANYAIQLGSGGSVHTNSDASTFKVYNGIANYELMSADGTIPEARLADTTSATAGQVLALDSNLNAVWQNPGSSLPDMTGQSGKFLTTDGTDASWATISSGSTTLSGLSDVSLTSPSSGQYLKFDGTNWVNDSINVSGYLPTTGGTMSGEITFSDVDEGITWNGTSSYTQYIHSVGSTGLIFGSSYSVGQAIKMDLGRAEISPNHSYRGYLGSSSNIWSNGYISVLHVDSLQGSFSDDYTKYIDIPNQGGTMVVADVSSATSGQVLTLGSNLVPAWTNKTPGARIRVWGANE